MSESTDVPPEAVVEETPEPEVVVEAPPVVDQPSAMEAALLAGTLPEEDRRAPDVPEPCEVCTELERAGVGSTIERQLHGWKMKFVNGGTVVLTEGATITGALHQR